MNTLTITKKNALEAFKKTDGGGKLLLSTLFGKDVFDQKKTEWIKTFKDVCDEMNTDPDNYAVKSSMSYKQKADMYEARLDLIAQLFNEDWVADLADTSQRKYYPWFNIIKDSSRLSGFGLSYGDYGCDGSGSGLGARPYFKDELTATYVGKQFIAEFEARAQFTNLSKLEKK